MTTIAAIDVGSNGIRMLVGRIEVGRSDAAQLSSNLPHDNGNITTLESIRLPVRLGQDAFTVGRFSEQTMEMAVDAFRRFRTVAHQYEVSRARAVATSAMREAVNSRELMDRIAEETGFHIDVISGEEEARLIHLAVSSAVDLHGKTALLIDIGGGSIEVLLSNSENIISVESFDLGTVRLLRKLDDAEGRSLPLQRLLHEYAASARRYIGQEIGKDRVNICLGTGGNIEEMGRLRRRLLKRQRLDRISLDDLDTLIDRLGQMSVEERVEKLGLNPDRADVILPAAIVLQMIAKEARVKTVRIPGVGLKDGILLDQIPLALEPRRLHRLQIMTSAERMGRKYGYDAEHAMVTSRMAADLFEQSRSLHHLPESDCLLLEVAAMLHDIGHYINTVDHDRHGYYLLMHHPLFGLTALEREVVANVVCYHRKQAPSSDDKNFESLSSNDRDTVVKLCALLRLADALDLSHLGRILSINLERVEDNTWQLQMLSAGEAMLEKWALVKRKSLFEEVFNVCLEIV